MINNPITRRNACFKYQSPEAYYLPTCCVGGKYFYHPQCSGCDGSENTRNILIKNKQDFVDYKMS